MKAGIGGVDQRLGREVIKVWGVGGVRVSAGTGLPDTGTGDLR